MANGLYLYCIAGTQETEKLGNIGLYEKPVHTISFKDIGAVVSAIPFKEIQPNVNEINWHQRVVEASRENWATLPVRFGTIFKSDDSLRKYLATSYKDLRSKITKFKNKDEYEALIQSIETVATRWFERDGKLVMTKVVGGILATK